jgi:pyruvate dehydrogenase E1 component alpha subunit
MDGRGDVAVGYFGDGASEEGVFHESLNLAANLELPIVFVCENNLFASHMHIALRQPSDSTARFAQANHIPCEVVDGNNVVALADVAKKAIDRARLGGGPSFLEAITYRWRGHVGPREDIDVGVKRGEELGQWKHRDPIQRLATALEQARIMPAARFSRLKEEVANLIEEAWSCAAQAPYPDQAALLDWVHFSNGERAAR